MAVHKISANDAKKAANDSAQSKSTKVAKAAKPAKTVKAKATKTTRATSERRVPAILKPFVALGGYFKGAWLELREVRWPTRKATWSLTLAVLAFTAFFMVLILLLDAGYKVLFETILQ